MGARICRLALAFALSASAAVAGGQPQFTPLRSTTAPGVTVTTPWDAPAPSGLSVTDRGLEIRTFGPRRQIILLDKTGAIYGVFDPLYNGDGGKEGVIVSIRLATEQEASYFPPLKDDDYIVIEYTAGGYIAVARRGFIGARPTHCDGSGPEVVRRNIACTLDLQKAQEAENEAMIARMLVKGPPASSFPPLQDVDVADAGLVVHFGADHRTVWATDRSGRELWREDPFVTAKMKPYRIFVPLIDYVGTFGRGWFSEPREAEACADNGKEAVAIGYSSSQFGCLNARTGRFVFLGQD